MSPDERSVYVAGDADVRVLFDARHDAGANRLTSLGLLELGNDLTS